MRNLIKPVVQTMIVGLLPLVGWAGPVNINTADATTLAAELNGIGLSKAQAIVADRNSRGEFKTAADLARVKGVGQRIVAMNKDNIRVGKPRK